MDRYHEVHGRDLASFDISSTHRLPTVSAAQALEDLSGDPSRCVSTGLEDLDGVLASAAHLSDGSENPDHGGGGIARAQVTEIWGPPGAGKTAVGIQLAATALSEGHAVVWVDCFYTVCIDRLRRVVVATATRRGRATRLDAQRDDGDSAAAAGSDAQLQNFIHFSCPTLPHLVALLCRPTASNLPLDTAIVVIDGLSALVNHAFPRVPDGKNGGKPGKGFHLAGRRHQTLQHLSSALQKLAATRDCAVIVLSQCATKMQSEKGATLIPAVNAGVWDHGISTRLALFKDWIWRHDKTEDVCFMAVQKLDGKVPAAGTEHLAAFRVDEEGLISVSYDASQPSVVLSATTLRRRRKRKYDDAGLEEVADSDEEDEDDEDYGWQEEDDADMPRMPSQWQGSEDLILGLRNPDGEVQDSEDDGGSDYESVSERRHAEHDEVGGEDGQAEGRREGWIGVGVGNGDRDGDGDSGPSADEEASNPGSR